MVPCTEVHQRDKETGALAGKLKVESQIKQYYTEYTTPQYLPEDRYLFEEATVKEQLAQHRDDQLIWLQVVSWAQEMCDNKTTNKNHQLRISLETWLQSG